MSKENKMKDSQIQEEKLSKEAIHDTQEKESHNERSKKNPDKKALHKEDELKEVKEQLATLNDRYLRVSAEYDNYRKRTAKEKADLVAYGGEKILAGLLTVVDDLELALQNIETAEDLQAMKKGIDLIVQKFFSFLKKNGVEPMEVLQKPFDMASQQAIATIKTDDPKEKGMVLDCTKKGYTLHDKVLRYADVVVGE